MKRSFKFPSRPTARQERASAEMLRDHRMAYNAALQERRDAYRNCSRTSVTCGMQSAQLRETRMEDVEGQLVCSAEAHRHLSTFPKKRAQDRTKQHRAPARKVAKLHGAVQRQRRDHHKTALVLVRAHGANTCEDLNIAGMPRAPESKPCPDEPGALPPTVPPRRRG